MTNEVKCRDCHHHTPSLTCDFPTPHWVSSTSPVMDSHLDRECNTFSQKMMVHITPAIDEGCQHDWPEDESGQTDMYGFCEKCGLSFQRYIHSCFP